MKIDCHCGALIVDQTDYLPHKGHIIPDQDWFDTFDAIDDEVIDPVVDGKIDKEAAYWQARLTMNRSQRMMYECCKCGRIYIEDHRHRLQSYLPEDKDNPKEILRSRESTSEGLPGKRLGD